MWPNREKHRAWTIAERCGCLVVRLTSSFCTWWYHLIPNSFCRLISLSVTATWSLIGGALLVLHYVFLLFHDAVRWQCFEGVSLLLSVTVTIRCCQDDVETSARTSVVLPFSLSKLKTNLVKRQSTCGMWDLSILVVKFPLVWYWHNKRFVLQEAVWDDL